MESRLKNNPTKKSLSDSLENKELSSSLASKQANKMFLIQNNPN